VNGAENVAVDRESARLGCCEDDSVCFTRHYWYARVEVVCYRKAVGLRLVKIAYQEVNLLPFLNMHDWPWVGWGSVTYAVIEA